MSNMLEKQDILLNDINTLKNVITKKDEALLIKKKETEKMETEFRRERKIKETLESKLQASVNDKHQLQSLLVDARAARDAIEADLKEISKYLRMLKTQR